MTAFPALQYERVGFASHFAREPKETQGISAEASYGRILVGHNRPRSTMMQLPPSKPARLLFSRMHAPLVLAMF